MNQTKENQLKLALEQIGDNKLETLNVFCDLIIDAQLNNEVLLPEELKDQEATILKAIKDIIINAPEREGLHQETSTLDITVSD